MNESAKGSISFIIEEKKLLKRAKNDIIRILLFAVILVILLFLFKMKLPIQDIFILFLFYISFSFIFLFYRHITAVHTVIFEDDFLIIRGNKFNTPFSEKISYKELRLSVIELRQNGFPRLAGYQLEIRAHKQKGFVISENNNWTTLMIYKILKEIKERRSLQNIYRDDGTYFIEEIKQYLKGNAS